MYFAQIIVYFTYSPSSPAGAIFTAFGVETEYGTIDYVADLLVDWLRVFDSTGSKFAHFHPQELMAAVNTVWITVQTVTITTTQSVKLFLADDDSHRMNVLKITSVSVQQQRKIHHESTKH